MWVLWALFCAIQYISDPRCLPGDEDITKTWKLRSKEGSGELRTAAMESRRNYRNQQALQVVKLRKFRVAEKLLVDYGMKYSLY